MMNAISMLPIFTQNGLKKAVTSLQHPNELKLYRGPLYKYSFRKTGDGKGGYKHYLVGEVSLRFFVEQDGFLGLSFYTTFWSYLGGLLARKFDVEFYGLDNGTWENEYS